LILLTVGTQLPFDRLVKAVDAWCAANPGVTVVGQIGDPGPNGYRPAHFKWHSFIAPRKLEELMSQADFVIAHAGMGSIISALRHGRPIVIMPRRALFGEHRNEHQLATASRLAGRQGLHVAEDELKLPAALQLATAPADRRSSLLSAYAQPRLVQSIRRYILTGSVGSEPVSSDTKAPDGDLVEDFVTVDQS
jgi:exopolysaccharide biosynthesis glucuronosyltransferase PssE